MKYLYFCFALCLLGSCSKSETAPEPEPEKIVGHFGRLQTEGRHLVDQYGDVFVLRGMSLFWSQWGGDYYNKNTISWLRDDWKCTVIRAAVGVENGGYLENKTQELNKLYRVIDACLELGIYVIVDWHDHHAEDHLTEAKVFFAEVSSKYGNHPNIIYEIYNEPLQVSWSNVVKPYAEAVIPEIRKNDPSNLIIVGTPNWSQDVDAVVGDTLADPNVAYGFHFYTGTHKQSIRDKANAALLANLPLFVSEWGLSEADGGGNIDFEETALWTQFLDLNKISSCNWTINNKNETCSALLPATTTLQGWLENELTQSGKFIRSYLVNRNNDVFEQIK